MAKGCLEKRCSRASRPSLPNQCARAKGALPPSAAYSAADCASSRRLHPWRKGLGTTLTSLSAMEEAESDSKREGSSSGTTGNYPTVIKRVRIGCGPCKDTTK